MKATLIKKAEGWYNLYQDKIGIGSTHSELQGYKLSKQNCDDIFGVFNVESLAKEEFPNDFDCTLFETLGVTKKSHKSILIGMLQGTLIKGFNKAMELNKDKQFTFDDIRMAIAYGEKHRDMDAGKVPYQTFVEFIPSLQQLTEIEVEVEMEKVVDETKVVGAVKGVKGSGDKITTYKSVPKLNADGCIILKKAR
jgi:hypothetical protein